MFWGTPCASWRWPVPPSLVPDLSQSITLSIVSSFHQPNLQIRNVGQLFLLCCFLLTHTHRGRGVRQVCSFSLFNTFQSMETIRFPNLTSKRGFSFKINACSVFFLVRSLCCDISQSFLSQFFYALSSWTSGAQNQWCARMPYIWAHEVFSLNPLCYFLITAAPVPVHKLLIMYPQRL